MHTIFDLVAIMDTAYFNKLNNIIEDAQTKALQEIKAMEQSLEAYKAKPNPSQAYIYIAEQRIIKLVEYTSFVAEAFNNLINDMQYIVHCADTDYIKLLQKIPSTTPSKAYMTDIQKELIRSQSISNHYNNN